MSSKQARRAWVVALRSGKYRQARNRLAIKKKGNHWAYCCLGVACEVYHRLGGVLIVDTVNEGTERVYGEEMTGLRLPEVVRKWLGLYDNVGHCGAGTAASSLAGANDICRMTFKQIADLIDDNRVVLEEKGEIL